MNIKVIKEDSVKYKEKNNSSFMNFQIGDGKDKDCSSVGKISGNVQVKQLVRQKKNKKKSS